MNNGEDSEHAEEYYNCGYDGVYEPSEKAVIFNCIGRGLKLPPLSEIYVPPFLLKGYGTQSGNIRPSHHVLELLSKREASPPKLALHEKQTSKLQSSRRCPESSDDVHSESSDLDVYISDEDSTVDENDCHPDMTNFRVHKSSKKEVFLPVNLICKAEAVCSPSGNKVIVTEIDPVKSALNENDDSATSDDEILSNPSYGEDSGSDNEEVSVATNNLNTTLSCGKMKHFSSTNNLNGAVSESVHNISLDKDLNTVPSDLLKASDSSQTTTSIMEHRTSQPHEQSSISEKLCVEENIDSQLNGRRESSPSNRCGDPIAEMFSSDESEKDFFVTHFRSFQRDVKLSVDCKQEFPDLPTKQTKQTQNPQNKRQVESLPESQLKIKNIAKLLLSDPTDISTNEKSAKTEANKRDLITTSPEILVIDNLPQNIDGECLSNFLQQFGFVHKISLIPFHDKVIAKIQIDADFDWIIECLDGSDPFGAESQTLRCYRE